MAYSETKVIIGGLTHVPILIFIVNLIKNKFKSKAEELKVIEVKEEEVKTEVPKIIEEKKEEVKTEVPKIIEEKKEELKAADVKES